MKLLFITQKVDKDDDLLGVYHRWIEGLAKRVEKISVICLYQGKTDLPGNVGVYSLGKESGRSRIKYLWRFYKYIWRLRREYDAVFVHMNPEYMLLAGWWWRLTGKKAFLWYNHPMGNWQARLAIAFSRGVFHTSPFAFAARYKKAIMMPVGVDTGWFKPIANGKSQMANGFRILFLGRIAPVKRVDVLLKAFSILSTSQVHRLTLTIVGGPTPGKPVEAAYYEEVKKLAADPAISGRVEFRPPVPNSQTPEIYNQHDLFVNLTDTGSFDKTIIEAMACEVPVIVSNRALVEVLPKELVGQLVFEEKDPDDLAAKMRAFLNLPPAERGAISKKMRALVVEKHDLNVLLGRLVSVLTR